MEGAAATRTLHSNQGTGRTVDDGEPPNPIASPGSRGQVSASSRFDQWASAQYTRDEAAAGWCSLELQAR